MNNLERRLNETIDKIYNLLGDDLGMKDGKVYSKNNGEWEYLREANEEENELYKQMRMLKRALRLITY